MEKRQEIDRPVIPLHDPDPPAPPPPEEQRCEADDDLLPFPLSPPPVPWPRIFPSL